MADALATTLEALTAMQRKAVEWDDGPLLVLAGPGSGKTRVLTCRIAKLLEESPKERFRVLALTFTNKAAHEMKTRVGELVPGLEERTLITTFHGFCAQMLRQHGAHLGYKPDFQIYSRTADREAVLADALSRDSTRFSGNTSRLIRGIDALKAKLVSPDQADQRHVAEPRPTYGDSGQIALAYRLYEDELRRSNAMDFNSLILNAFNLLQHRAFAKPYQTTYRYWLIDEFQDTNASQYRLLRRMAGNDFRNLFAVADDDQTIYEWNGANVRRIGQLVGDFRCEVIQLTDNFRCPPNIVEAANRLVVYNPRRGKTKQPAKAAKRSTEGAEPEIPSHVFNSDADEASSIAVEIAALDRAQRNETAVLARSRALLGAIKAELDKRQVPCELVARRDDFATPQMRWLVACLKQVNRPLDPRNMAVMNEAYRSYAGEAVDIEEIVSRSQANQTTLLVAWVTAMREVATQETAALDTVAQLASGDPRWRDAVKNIIQHFKREDGDGDLTDDISAWGRIEREIRQARGNVGLDEFLQELEMRSKEPVAAPNSVSLATIHAAKGMEFDRVYLIGMAEEVLPSWHSVKNGTGSPALEEERRGCFVAITRARKHLILSRAESYKRRPKQPSRFLKEMGLLDLPQGNARRKEEAQ